MVCRGAAEKTIDQLEALLATPYFLSPVWLRFDATFALRFHVAPSIPRISVVGCREVAGKTRSRWMPRRRFLGMGAGGTSRTKCGGYAAKSSSCAQSVTF